MRSILSKKIRLDQIETEAISTVEWLWTGYLARGNITLLTSRWKFGKTTLLANLARSLVGPGRFLGQPCRAAKVLIVSEESSEHWKARQSKNPIGSHVEVACRPFRNRPTLEEWNDLIDEAIGLRMQGLLDLFVVDTLAPFLPGRCESDAGTLLETLLPLQRLAAQGVSVLLLHHPRKQNAEAGSTARGSSALLGFVDIIAELHRCRRTRTESTFRNLIAKSRWQETPSQVAFDWNPLTDEYAVIDDLVSYNYLQNWKQLNDILSKRECEATHHELLMDWPAEDEGKPSPSVFYEWLNRAADEKRVTRVGTGRRNDPYRYRLRNKADEYRDRGELPPLDLPYLDEDEEDERRDLDLENDEEDDDDDDEEDDEDDFPDLHLDEKDMAMIRRLAEHIVANGDDLEVRRLASTRRVSAEERVGHSA